MNRAIAAIFLTLTTLAQPAMAQPSPVLVNVHPLYLRQGETRDVVLTGQNLAEATAVFMVDPSGHQGAWSLKMKSVAVDAQGLSGTLLPVEKLATRASYGWQRRPMRRWATANYASTPCTASRNLSP